MQPESQKYPRTMHSPDSPGTQSDDRIMYSLEHFNGVEVVVTEKLDGECTTMYPELDHYHARSMDGRAHPSQDWCRRLHSMIRHDIPQGWRVCGENLYAKHSIYYDRLTTFFYVFSIWNEKNVSLPWDETVEYTALLNDSLTGTGMSIETVPVLYRGVFDKEKIKACWTGTSKFGDQQEGYVTRTVEAIPYPVPESDDVHQMPVFKDLFKFVRAKHVQTDQHWRRTWTPNKLIDKAD